MVEDDPAFADLVKRLHDEVPKMFTSTTELIVLQTLDMLKHVLATNGVELIILDLTLPDSGQEKTIEMLFHEAEKWPPVVVLCGDERLEVRDKCLMAGAASFVLKKHAIESRNFFFGCCYNARVKGLHHAQS